MIGFLALVLGALVIYLTFRLLSAHGEIELLKDIVKGRRSAATYFERFGQRLR
jgi:hypothetical protein